MQCNVVFRWGKPNILLFDIVTQLKYAKILMFPTEFPLMFSILSWTGEGGGGSVTPDNQVSVPTSQQPVFWVTHC